MSGEPKIQNPKSKITDLPNGVIFDMDGVLLDSERFIREAAMKMFAERGLAVHPEDFKPFIGAGENRFIGGVAEKYNFQIDIERDKARTYDIYLEIIKGRLRPLPGVIEFISECRRLKKKIAVASAADLRKVEGNLGEIGIPAHTFDAFVTGCEIKHLKPSPDIFLEAAGRLGIDPADCLVIEDAINGVKAAIAAGAKCLGITGSFSAQQLTAAGAKWTAPDLANAPNEVLHWKAETDIVETL